MHCSSSGIGSVTHRTLVSRTIRRDLCAQLLAALNVSGIPYCVLGHSTEGPRFDRSDVDIVVQPREEERFVQVLQSVAAETGARLVQDIRHETSGRYFVMAKQVDGHLGFLNPDCTTDYRKLGRLWLRAEELLRDRQKHRQEYWAPSVPGRFLYYLAKKVLKQSISSEGWAYLHKTYQVAPADCDEQMLGFWEPATAGKLRAAMLRDDLEWLRRSLPELRAQLLASPCREGLLSRRMQQFRNLGRIARRLVSPTGLLVTVSGAAPVGRQMLAQRLLLDLAPGFRRTHLIAAERVRTSTMSRLLGPLLIFAMLVRSTLVVVDQDDPVLRFLCRGVAVAWDETESLEQNAAAASSKILGALAGRLARRLRSHGAGGVEQQFAPSPQRQIFDS